MDRAFLIALIALALAFTCNDAWNAGRNADADSDTDNEDEQERRNADAASDMDNKNEQAGVNADADNEDDQTRQKRLMESIEPSGEKRMDGW